MELPGRSTAPPAAAGFELRGDEWRARTSSSYSDYVPVPAGCDDAYDTCNVTVDYSLEYFLGEADSSNHGFRSIEASAVASTLCCTDYIEVGDALRMEQVCPFAEGVR